jgi:hypothetical protein
MEYEDQPEFKDANERMQWESEQHLLDREWLVFGKG